MSFHTEEKIIKSYYLNKNSSDKTVELKFFDNYLCVSFFELITKMVLMNSKIDFIENVEIETINYFL